jgi:FAD/FMN-containing dehydrogenase
MDALHQLSDQVSGKVLFPGDPDYDKTRRGWNLTVDQHPALILVAADVEDVIAGVRFANAQNLGVAVQITGHGVKFPADDNLLIVTTQLNKVKVDAQARTARVEAGVIWQQVLDAATPHGLAPLLGTSPHVGVVGYTLGGGFGWLGRLYGLAADSVRSIDVVTPDAVLRHTSPTKNSELFWALLGGGGNFGVVTALEFALYPVAKLYGGMLTYPGAVAADALRFYREWVKNAPDELTTHFVIFKYPDMPQLPDAVRGKTLVLVRAAYSGNAAEGEKLMQPWLQWQTPLANSFREMPFAEVATISNDPVDPVPTHATNDLLNELSDEAIEIIVRYATNDAAPIAFNELRHAGGAIARADTSANAIGNRDASFFLTIGGLAFNPQLHAAIDNYVHQYKQELRPYLHGGIYLNFSETKEARARVKDAYLPQNYERLLALKHKIDPKNLFRYSFPLVQ